MADIQEVSHNFSTANVAIVTTTETLVISTPPIAVVRASVFAMILGYAQLSTGADTTSVAKRIRRGTTTAGAQIGEGNAEEIKAAATSTEQLFIVAGEELSGVASVEYSLTLLQAGASANGAVLQSAILVLLM